MLEKRCWLLGAVLVAAAMGIAAADGGGGSPGRSEWPQFRGPNRDGISHETGLLDRWPPEGPRVLWRVRAGAGYSGVASDGDRIYTMWQQDGAQVLLCLDAKSGKELWRYRVGPAYMDHYGDGPRSTPVAHGTTVFAIGAQGHLHAVRGSDGKRLWEHDLKRLGAGIPSSGYASTPIVEDSRLVVEVGGGKGAYIAFDTATGEVAWRSGSDVAAYSSPIAVTIGGVRQIVFFSGGGLHAVSPRDGRVLWDYPLKSLCPVTGVPLNAASPVHIPPDRIFISTGYGEDQGAVVIRIIAEDGRFRVEPVWRNEVLKTRINSAILVDGHLYGFNGGTLKSVRAATGEERWRASGYQRGSVIGADGKLIVLSELGKLALVEADPDAYREIGSVRIFEDRSWTPPTLAGRRLYLRNQEELVCLDLSGDREG